MASLIPLPFNVSNPKNSRSSPKSTYSPVWEDGLTPFASPSGPTPAPSGPVPVHVNLFPLQAKGKEPRINVTSGPTCGDSLTTHHPSLQSCLESKYRARLDCYGSPEYGLIWKHWPMKSGPSILARRASGHRTLDNGYGGWPNPSVGNAQGSQMGKGASATGRRADGSKTTVSLNHVARMARMTGWPTTRTTDGTRASTVKGAKAELKRKGGPQDLPCAVMLTGWPTTTTRDWKSNQAPPEFHKTRMGQTRGKALPEVAGWTTPQTHDAQGKGSAKRLTRHGTKHGCKNLQDEVHLGMTPPSSPASTANTGALNPAFSLWLMGYPLEYLNYAP